MHQKMSLFTGKKFTKESKKNKLSQQVHLFLKSKMF